MVAALELLDSDREPHPPAPAGRVHDHVAAFRSDGAIGALPEGLKMGELSKRLMVTGGNVTGITDLLEKEGLVTRVTDERDRRASRVKLTPSGQRLFKKMAAEHERWIVDLLDGLAVQGQAAPRSAAARSQNSRAPTNSPQGGESRMTAANHTPPAFSLANRG